MFLKGSIVHQSERTNSINQKLTVLGTLKAWWFSYIRIPPAWCMTCDVCGPCWGSWNHPIPSFRALASKIHQYLELWSGSFLKSLDEGENKGRIKASLGGSLKYVFIFTSIWGRFLIWLICSDGLKPPTRSCLNVLFQHHDKHKQRFVAVFEYNPKESLSQWKLFCDHSLDLVTWLILLMATRNPVNSLTSWGEGW